MKTAFLPLLACAFILAACTDLTGPDPDAPAFREDVPATAPALADGALADPRDDVPFILFDPPERDENPADFSASITGTNHFSVTVEVIARNVGGHLYYVRQQLQYSHPKVIGAFNGTHASALSEQVSLIGASTWVEYWLVDEEGAMASPRMRLPLPGARRP